MSTKLLACLLAACLVVTGGAYLYMDKSPSCGMCPFSSSKAKTCPSSAESDCADCCTQQIVAKTPINCCDTEEDHTTVAIFGGVAAAK